MASTLSAARYENSVIAEGRNRVFLDLAAQGQKILEFGCSTGFLSRHLVERGCKVTGVEIDAEAAEKARQWCDQVFVADLNKPDWTNSFSRNYDTILFGDVLEHLVDPARVLRQAAELLLPDGRVVISCPILLIGKFAPVC